MEICRLAAAASVCLSSLMTRKSCHSFMITLLEQEGKVTSADSFEAAVRKVKTALRKHVNDVHPIYKVFCEMQQGQQTFVEWYP